MTEKPKKKPAPEAAPDTPAKPALPRAGGSYTVDKDGKLERRQHTKAKETK